MNKGFLYALIAYVSWGLLPFYWKSLQALPALEIMGHRIVWSFLFVALVLSVRRQWSWIRHIGRRTAVTFVAVAGLIGLNWYTYIWAVNAGFIVETSLGYFINPLVNVALGAIFLRERLRNLQWVAIAMAATGVLYLTISYGQLPWISLTLAFTFGFYGLLKKTAALEALEGLTLEMAILLLPAMGYLLYLINSDSAAFLVVPPVTKGLMVGAGVITAIPLLSFAAGARRITLASLGLMQYIAPSLQFCIGVFVYDEPFSLVRLLGFAIIWVALALYTGESLLHHHKQTAERRLRNQRAMALQSHYGEDRA